MAGSKALLHSCVSLVGLCAAGAALAQTAEPSPTAAARAKSTPPASMALANDAKVSTPIQHVMVIVGENRTFDHLFATLQPRRGSVNNMLARGVVRIDGSPGRDFTSAAQQQASDTTVYAISPTLAGPYGTLPPENTGFSPTAPSNTAPPPFATRAAALSGDYGLMPQDIGLLLTGASGLPQLAIDTRIKHVNNLPNGPFRLTGLYDAYLNSPVHRFYQMWQETDCAVTHATVANPSGCNMDLFPWVETTISAGSNGKPQPEPFTDETTGEGSVAMGFYDVARGDLPYFKRLIDEYTVSDNYHQPVMGGTGANSIMLGTGDLPWYSDGKGNALVPPANEIENPNPQPGTNNYYTQDGYSGGTYSQCADTTQPGVAPIVSYLNSLPYHPNPNCAAGHYYLLNNYNPGYFGNGTVDTVDTFTIPPSSTPTIADVLLANQVSWRYYGEGWNAYVQNPSSPANVYCNICNPFQYETAIMTNADVRATNLKDTTDLYTDLGNGQLPAVAFVKPGGLNDGHPESSKFDIFEAFVHKILDLLQKQPKLMKSTVVFITVDEGGGYYDGGYIQPLDYFGDGTRIPLIAVSEHTRGGFVNHSYADHVSILKFIEKNWGLPKISTRSRDNLANPIATKRNPYVPTNSPALSDLTDLFDFGR